MKKSIFLLVFVFLTLGVYAQLAEIPDFKNGWSWVIGTKANTVAEILTAEAIEKSTAPAKLPVGNGNDGYAACRDYVAANGTTVGLPGNTPSLVLQKTVNIASLANYAGFMMDLIIDEGAVVYVNGQEALLLNVVEASGSTLTSQSGDTRTFGYEKNYVIGDPILYPNKSTFEKLFINKSLFQEGDNVITVAILQDGKASSDILFDGMLYAVPNSFEDITPSGTSIASENEWLWTINNPGNDEWMLGDFIAAAVAIPTEYKASGWRINKTPLGYTSDGGNVFNQNPSLKPFTTEIPYSTSTDYKNQPNYPVANVYLRRVIEIDDLSKISNLEDGALTMKLTWVRNITVYVNGKKVHEKTDATNHNKNEVEVPISISDLKNGRNIISVDLKHTNPLSTSIYFDIELPIEIDDTEEPITEITEITDFKTGWYYTVNTNAATVSGLGILTENIANLPAGNAGGSSPNCQALIENNGTSVGVSGSSQNIVFQKKINIKSLENYAGFAMDATVDDGAVVFINGQEALRLNSKKVATGTDGIRTFGYERRYVINDPVDQVNKSTFKKLFIDKNMFTVGDNTITVAVLQDTPSSGDIVFDGMLHVLPKDLTDATPLSSTLNLGSEWLWIKNDREDSWLSESFIPLAAETTYNSYAWRKGNAPFGYNTPDNSLMVDVATDIPNPPNRNAATNVLSQDPNHQTNDIYLRRILEIDDIDRIEGEADVVTMTVSRVRNVTVYVNGEEVLNTTDGTNNVMRKDVVIIPINKFKTGNNVISVNLANSSPASSCIYFDMKLVFGNELTATSFAMTPGKDETELGFLWQTPVAVVGKSLQVAKTTDYIDNGFTDVNTVQGTTETYDATYNTNKVTVTGLEHETEYTYRYGNSDNNAWSAISTFKTGKSASSENTRNQFIVVGDPTIGGESGLASTVRTWKANLAAAETKIPDARFILSVGDNANDQDSHYEILKDVDQFKRLPFASTTGNHETAAFPKHFNFPNLTGLGKSDTGGRGYTGEDHYFSYGNTLFMMINSFSSKIAEHKQAMEQAIASHPDAKWRVVVTHFDVYGAGPHSNGNFDYWRNEILHFRENLTPVYDELGIDIVINGHDHSYTRSHFMKGKKSQRDQVFENDGKTVVNPIGTLYITASCGSDGRFYNPANYPARWDVVEWVNVVGTHEEAQYTDLDITDDILKISTYTSVTDVLVDEFSIRKDDTRTNIDFVSNDLIEIISSPGVLTIRSPEKAELKIYNTTGQLLIVQTIEEGDNLIRVNHLSEGMHIVRLDGREVNVSKKIIIR